MPTSRTFALPPILLALALAGCGGDSGGSSAGGGGGGGGNQQQQGGPRGGGMFAQLTDEQRACIEKQGVELPQMPQGAGGNGAPPDGAAPPQGGEGYGPPPGGAPNGDGGTRTAPDGARPQQGGGQFAKLREAMEKCGVDLPERPQGAPGGGTQTAPSQGTSRS